MDEQTKTLRFEIDGRWSVHEMTQFLSHTRDLYNLSILLKVVFEDWHDMEKFWFEFMRFPPFRKAWRWRMIHPSMMPFLGAGVPSVPTDPDALARLASFVYPQEELQIRKIKYGSPGFSDLAGAGEAIGHIKDFVLKIIEHWVARRQTNLENEERELKNQKLRIENAREFVQLAKDCGYTEAETRRLLNWVDEKQETYIILIENGKLRKVHFLEEKTNNAEPE